MSYSQQIAHSLHIDKLKGIVGLLEIRFDEKPLTAILGPNGCGKSTILHALACCYKPQEVEQPQANWRFRDFFTPTTDATWAGSRFSLIHSFREGKISFPNVLSIYRKDGDRWSPRYDTRPDRHITFIGIKSCVPKIEEETSTSMIRYVTAAHRDQNLIRQKMSAVFNRNYLELNIHLALSWRSYNGLAIDGARYSSLSMGAGEQRVLLILSTIFNAPKHSLILIDEIDLLLHTAALKTLLHIIYERAEEKSIQVVFTTHREVVLELSEIISIKHIHTIGGKTFCFSDTKPDAIQRLTGAQHRPIEIFVEDDMANAIVSHVLQDLGMRRLATIRRYGAATNCFTLAAGLLLAHSFNENRQLFLMDGDVYRDEEARLERVQEALAGTEEAAPVRRQSILRAIKMLNPADGVARAPEAQLHRMIRELFDNANAGDVNADAREIIDIAMEIHAVDDNHSFLNRIIETLNLDRAVGLAKIVEVAAASPRWPEYVLELNNWLVELRPDFEERRA